MKFSAADFCCENKHTDDLSREKILFNNYVLLYVGYFILMFIYN
jgi:hypothetical protein